MIVVALLFITVGIADLVRERFRRPIGPVIGIAAGAIAAVLVAGGTGLSAWWAVAAIGLMVAWVAATALPSAGQSGYLKIALLGAAVTAGWAFTPAQVADDSVVARWYAELPHAFAEAVDVETFLLAVGGVLVLVETANIVVRLVFAAAPRGEAPAPTPASPARRPWFARGTEVASSPSPVNEPPLKGGRIIGPFERIFLLSLVVAGQFTALAALVAAKGIIRFPEISRDGAGTKAEYFLVGSFASWAVVLVVAVLLRTS